MAQILTEQGNYGTHWLRCRGCQAEHEIGSPVTFSARYRPAHADPQVNRKRWGLPAHYDSASDPEHQRIREWMAAHADCPDAHLVEHEVAGVPVIDRRRWQ